MLIGQWRPHILAGLWPDKADAVTRGEKIDLAEAPLQLPTRVMLVLARDPAQRLFPHRIEYQRVGRGGEMTTLMSLDYFDVRRNLSLDPRLFAYKPGDQEVEDKTEEQMRNLGL